MRSWYLSRLALERRFEPHHEQQWGVYDRRPSMGMMLARIVSGCLAFIAFVFGLSATSAHHSHYGGFVPPGSNYSGVSSSTYPASQSISADASYPSITKAGILVKASDGTELVVQRSVGHSRGTILLLHGCSHSATDYFPPGKECLTCRGLPESLKIARNALERGYNVVAVSSTNRDRKCWQTNSKTGEGEDYDRVRTALHEANQRNAYSPNLPLYVVGGSSGGFFASSLPLKFPISGVNCIISTSVCVFWADKDKVGSNFPPHAFTHMGTRDKNTAQRVKHARQIFDKLGIRNIEFNVEPKPVTEQYLQDAVPNWNSTVISEVVTALKLKGHLDEHYFLVADPRRSEWRKSVEHLKEKLEDSLVADQSPLSEELNRAWAGHETTSDYFMQTLDFFEEKAVKSVISKP